MERRWSRNHQPGRHPTAFKARSWIDDIKRMSPPWQTILLDHLASAADTQGGWAYRPQGRSCAEPTALACLALANHRPDSVACAMGMAWLGKHQLDDGSVPSSATPNAPAWTTGLATLAWSSAPPSLSASHRDHVDAAARWLLSISGEPIPPRPDFFGHDSTLCGWPWVRGTHSWIEPTAYAILALRAIGRADNDRVREGLRVIFDRAIPGGGWNHGNTRVYQQMLPPFPAPTGIVLAALSGMPRTPGIDAAIEYLTRMLADVRAPITLGWGVLGLTAWHARPAAANAWLAESAARISSKPGHSVEAALLLLADATKLSFLGEPSHG